MGWASWIAVAVLCAACGDSNAPAIDAAAVADAVAVDTSVPADAGPDASLGDRLTAERVRLLTTAGGDICTGWDALDDSQRAVFLTLTHRLFISITPDGLSMLEHMTTLHLILGGGADGTDCGGAENNRLFLSMDAYVWQQLVDTWNDVRNIGDGGGSTWKHTGDLAGPHAPFTASDETDTGLRCAVLVELPDSKPPTAQGHFFLAGDQVPVQRGAAIDLPADQYMFEVDQDYNCVHDSNPTCSDFATKYVTNYGDYVPAWRPPGC